MGESATTCGGAVDAATPRGLVPRGRPKRPGVLMVISHYPPAVGGTERQARNLAVGLVKAGHRVTVLTMERDDAPRCEVREGVHIARSLTARGRGFAFAVTYGLSLLRHLTRLRPGHVILHGHHLYLEAMAAAWVGNWAGLPTIAKVACGGPDGDFARLSRTRTAMGAPLLRRLHRVVAISAEVEADLLVHGFAADRITRIPNGVDLDHFRPSVNPTADRARVGFGPETVLFLGRLDPQKGLDLALTAWQRVAGRRSAARLILAGHGPNRHALETQVQALGLGASVRFLGARQDPDVLLRGAQVFVLPSRSEGMSNALLEAMASGVACVASRIGGNTDLLEDGRTGLLTAPGDVDALADALSALLDDAELRGRLGAAARTAVAEQYGMDRVVRRYSELYAELAGGRT